MKHEIVSSPEEGGDPINTKEIGVKALNSFAAGNCPETPMAMSEIAEKFEHDGFVKLVPFFEDQLKDSSRANTITHITGMHGPVDSSTYSGIHAGSYETTTEVEALQSLDAFLGQVEQSPLSPRLIDQAVSMRENLTYIGEKEYNEAASGIADYWKALLETDPEQQILVITGEIAPGKVKSDEYLRETILRSFSEEEREKYKGRLLLNTQHMATVDPKNTKIVLLDDWVISGMQMTGVFKKLTAARSELAGAIEIHLIAADEYRIEDGLEYLHGDGSKTHIPVKSYFRTHSIEDMDHDAYITGSHSSVDGGFENIIAEMVRELRSLGIHDVEMPPPTLIVRRYGEQE